jgi:hypothetical protein
MEARPGAMDAQPGAFEDRPGVMQAHPGAIEDRQGALEAHHGAVEACPGAMESLSRAVEAHMESILAQMGAFGTIGSHPDEDYSMRSSPEWAYNALHSSNVDLYCSLEGLHGSRVVLHMRGCASVIQRIK